MTELDRIGYDLWLDLLNSELENSENKRAQLVMGELGFEEEVASDPFFSSFLCTLVASHNTLYDCLKNYKERAIFDLCCGNSLDPVKFIEKIRDLEDYISYQKEYDNIFQEYLVKKDEQASREELHLVYTSSKEKEQKLTKFGKLLVKKDPNLTKPVK